MSATEKNKKICVHVREAIRRDMADVLDIEQHCFEFPWNDDAFLRCLRQRNCIGMVAEYEGRVIGFMVYKLSRTRIHVLNFAVHPLSQRRGVGKQMIANLIAELSTQRKSWILLEIRETNVPAQIFFRECGFRAISILRSYYDDTSEDAYLFRYRYRPENMSPTTPK